MTSFYFANPAADACGHRVRLLSVPAWFRYSASAEPRVKSAGSQLRRSRSVEGCRAHRRCTSASRQRRGVCADRPTATPISCRARRSRKCLERAIADAVAQVDRPSLTALHKEEASRTARG